MKHEILGGDAYPLVKFHLDKGEAVKAESGAMVALSEGLTLKGKADGGVGKAIARMFSGESFFMQNIEATDRAGWALLAAATPGEVTAIEIGQGDQLTVQKGGFLAATPGIEVSTKAQGIMKGLFSGEGFFVVKINGQGTAFIATYGAIHTLTLKEGENVLIDNGHLVAWDSHMKYEIAKGAVGWVSSVTSGEGLACRFTGPGRVFIQSRNPAQLGIWLLPFLPLQRRAG
jgi:uncharacterized protein (TIGR00266 family)